MVRNLPKRKTSVVTRARGKLCSGERIEIGEDLKFFLDRVEKECRKEIDNRKKKEIYFL